MFDGMAGGQWALVGVVVAACIVFVYLVPFALMAWHDLRRNRPEDGNRR